MSALWLAYDGPTQMGLLESCAIRVVESQAQVATLSLADTTEEQLTLEGLLEGSKPPLPPAPRNQHYLILTPFRYPPLPHGSRFGLRTRPGIFYASQQYATALAECAYYRFLFWQGMATPPPLQRLMTEHTTFEVRVGTRQAVPLTLPPFANQRPAISHPDDYRTSQALGEAMREAGVEAFVYFSARAGDNGTNLGLFTPAAIRNRKLQKERLWVCATSAESVSFVRLHANDERYQFSLEQFLYQGKLPVPAC